MNQSDIDILPTILISLLILIGFAAFPFIKAYIMYFATRLFKFQNLSYWKSFFCVLIGIGIMMAIQMILFGLIIQQGRAFDHQAMIEASMNSMLISLVLVPIAEALSLYLFFRESPGKTAGTIVLTYIFIILLILILFLFAFILKVLINPGT